MIAKVVHGWRAGGLLAYLFGPGIADEHRNPRVIASWDGRDAAWLPVRRGAGEHDLELGPLIRAMQAPAVAAGLPLRAPKNASRGYVWHCSVRLAESDRALSDTDWASIARELLHDAGVATRGDRGGPRWVAIRHADDHIHIAAVLVRQDTGRRFWPRHDYPKLRASAQRIEARLGLRATAPAEKVAAKRPHRGELAKAERESRRPAREVLRAATRRAALRSASVAEFEQALQREGLLVTIRRGPSGDALGYAVALPPDLLAAGEPVFYSGSKLAPDLSLPRLQRRWDAQPPGPLSRVAASTAARRVGRIADALGAGDGDVAAAGQGLCDVLTAMSAVADVGARHRFSAAAERVRAATSTHPRPQGGGELTQLARRLLLVRRLQSDREQAGVDLALALARLALVLADHHRRRPHARAAIESAAQIIRSLEPSAPSTMACGAISGERARNQTR